MIDKLLLVPMVISFFVTLFVIPSWIKKAREIGLVWQDMNKFNKRDVSGSGGIMVVLGFLIGVFVYIAFRVFYLETKNDSLIGIFALLTVILMASGLGFVDDLLGWVKGGLSRRSRTILLVFASIPLIAINAGESLITLPFFGLVNLGIIYPVILIPIGVVGATTVFNILAGFNGLEAGQGILILSALGIVAYFTNQTWLTMIALLMIVPLIVFLLFNFSPSSVFPGDSLTYAVGALIAGISILGNFERVAVFFFIPYALESVLKLRGKLKMYSFGEPEEDGTLKLKYSKFYSLNHVAIATMINFGIRPTERKAVILIWAFQLVVIILGFVIFRGGIF